MGTWGSGITRDDAVKDIVDFFVDRLKIGSSIRSAVSETLSQFRELDKDEDEGPLLWLALAHVQWKYGGIVDPDILDHVRSDIHTERGLERWREDPKLLVRRRTALAAFVSRVESPNPKPSPIPRLIVRPAPFAEGDCLAVLTADGRYTAALVLAVDNKYPEYGLNMVARLDYLEDDPPTIAVFEQRPWLFGFGLGPEKAMPDVCWLPTVGFRSMRKRISVVGRVPLRDSDPKAAKSYTGWISLDLIADLRSKS